MISGEFNLRVAYRVPNAGGHIRAHSTEAVNEEGPHSPARCQTRTPTNMDEPQTQATSTSKQEDEVPPYLLSKDEQRVLELYDELRDLEVKIALVRAQQSYRPGTSSPFSPCFWISFSHMTNQILQLQTAKMMCEKRRRTRPRRVLDGS